MTPIDLERLQLTPKRVTNQNVESLKTKSKNSLKGGSVQKKIEINDNCLDEIFINKKTFKWN